MRRSSPMPAEPKISTDTRAALLLCGRFGVKRPGIKPLTQSEFHELDRALAARNMRPGNLLGAKPSDLLSSAQGSAFCGERLSLLLGRADELDEALFVWAEAGIWVIGERDEGYPVRLRRRLSSSRPPLLFGAGDMGRLDQGGVCIVGSRDSQKPALHFSTTIGARCAHEGLTVISSDMRGVDREAVKSTLSGKGRALIVLSDRLVKTVTVKRYREALADGFLTMVTPFSPDAGFSVANALRVNRYQYALSDVAVVVETRRKGGIWSGAEENRSEKWVPAFVRTDKTMSSGNQALLHLGLYPLTQNDIETVKSLGDFFISQTVKYRESSTIPRVSNDKQQDSLDLYSVFLAEFQIIAGIQPRNETEIMKHFDIERVQVRKWLQRALMEGSAEKLKSAGKVVWRPES